MTPTSKHIQEPLDRIATGWRITYESGKPWPWAVFNVVIGGVSLCDTADEAKADYLRLTSSL